MKISEAGLRFVESFEGYHDALPDGRCQAYRCIVGRDKKGRPIHDGKWTIGFGCTEGITEGLIWTREQAEQAFREELSHFEAAVNRLVKVPVGQNAFDALVSFSYNCGEGALAKSALKKLNKGDHEGAAREFGKWVNSKGVRNVPGLVRRRAEEAAMFLRPDPVATVPAEIHRESSNASEINWMPQTVDVPAPVKETLRTSRTIFSTLTAAGMFLAYIYHEAIEIVLAAAAQFDTLAPAAKVLSALGVSVAGVALIMAFAALTGAMFARLDDARNGANVK